MTLSEEDDNSQLNETFEQDNSLEYLPNELKFTSQYQNDTVDMILSGP